MIPRLSFFTVIAVLLITNLCRAEVTLPSILGDHMVLQRNMPIPLWGKAAPGESVTVKLGSIEQSTTADAQGRWRVTLPPQKEGGPLEIAIIGSSAPSKPVTIVDVLVGEVWLCSGQSNMEMPLSQAKNAEQEIAAATYPRIRLFAPHRAIATKPQDDCKGWWVTCTPKTAAWFSAAGYFFGRELHKNLDVPVGLIAAAWGGMPAESFMTRQTLINDREFKPIVDRFDTIIGRADEAAEKYIKAVRDYTQQCAKAESEGTPLPMAPPAITTKPLIDPRIDPNRPQVLFNTMIHPLAPFALRGVIWYQGETNAGRAYQYRRLFPAMIADWRRLWGQGDFPFLFVQLANFNAQLHGLGEAFWAELREAQLMTLSNSPNTGMAVTIDIGDANDIHPKNKQDVGRRLALWALAKTYGKSEMECSGPLYDSMTVEGNQIRIRFTHADPGLTSSGELMGFHIAGADRKWVPASARIDGQTVVVSSPQVPTPLAVRYGWHNNPTCNLTNAAQLPASPFRTDDWPGVTLNNR